MARTVRQAGVPSMAVQPSGRQHAQTCTNSKHAHAPQHKRTHVHAKAVPQASPSQLLRRLSTWTAASLKSEGTAYCTNEYNRRSQSPMKPDQGWQLRPHRANAATTHVTRNCAPTGLTLLAVTTVYVAGSCAPTELMLLTATTAQAAPARPLFTSEKALGSLSRGGIPDWPAIDKK